MKILYATLGAGNGHLSRATEILPYLRKHGEVDISVSGTDAQVSMSEKINYQQHGLIFHLGQRGGLDYWKTFKELRIPSLLRDIREFPIAKYDVVVNDFEPITARSAKRAGVPIVSLSHQASFASYKTPRPDTTRLRNLPAEAILKHYATCRQKIGLHFEPYDNFIRTPVIRRAVRDLKVSNDGHITVYLPAFDDAYLIDIFSTLPGKKFELFSKRSTREYFLENTHVRPVSIPSYTKSLGSCDGLLTGGGFEAPAEALFLGKKLLMIPQTGQFEQQCNAAAARRLGVTVLKTISEKNQETFANWAMHGKPIEIKYRDNAQELVAEAIERAK